jgi:chorismate lyase/3-hydroxybenzoate synthase
MTVEFAFGDTVGGSKGTLQMGLPLLAGDPREYVAGSVEPVQGPSGLRLWRGRDSLVGIAHAEAGTPIEEATGTIYRSLLDSLEGLNLYRIWNLVPKINAAAAGGLENYRAFCRGRSLAFEAVLGPGFARNLPAASAVGTSSTGLTVAFLAGSQPARHFENPSQVPAYEYPAEYGPRPPSFARATVVAFADGLHGFISGTSAVLGHETVAPHDTARQLDCTLENLTLISKTSGLGSTIGHGPAVTRHFKVFLRHCSDVQAVAAQMERSVLKPGDRVTYLGADICRSALNVEIEVAVRGSASS